jgi:hypothetical protein
MIRLFFEPSNVFFFQAYDQPDIYETADLPECSQNTDFYEVMNQNMGGSYLHNLM